MGPDFGLFWPGLLIHLLTPPFTTLTPSHVLEPHFNRKCEMQPFYFLTPLFPYLNMVYVYLYSIIGLYC